MNNENQILHDRLCDFLKESIPILRRNVEVKSLPTIRRYRIDKDNKRTRYVPYDNPNWWQIRDFGEIVNLPSLHNAIDVCQKHKRINSLGGKWSYAFGYGTNFHANNVPFTFLKELVSRENDLKFKEKTFENTFHHFLKYISQTDESYARLIVPFNNLSIGTKRIELEQDSRIHKLTPKETIGLINNCPILCEFYGGGLSRWFTCVLEFDIPFNWVWLEKQTPDEPNALLALIKSSDLYKSFEPRINREIVILRAISNRPISSPTYVIDYRGWESVMFSGGAINLLPWTRPKFPSPDELTQKEIRKYRKYRRKFLDMTNVKEQQRIFVAMRKLAFSLEKPYGGDEIMDTVSGLEGLLVDSTNEVRHKFAERVAVLLERNVKDRINLQKEMRDAYDLRSQVAHGQVITDDFDQIRSKISSGQQPSKKEMGTFNSIQRLRRKTSTLLHKAILMCIEKQTTDFDWDSSFLGTKISP